MDGMVRDGWNRTRVQTRKEGAGRREGGKGEEREMREERGWEGDLRS